MSTNNRTRRNSLSDPSLWFLLFSNGVTIFFALTKNWNLANIMWIYWFQSVTIGLFNFIQLLQLRDFQTEGIKINSKFIQLTNSAKSFPAFFFLLHYGTFHLVYLIFLLTGVFTKTYGNTPNQAELKYILLSAFLFFINHLFSYLYNSPQGVGRQSIGSLMFYPYARIIPMHVTIIFGFLFNSALPLFLVLKTLADATMHVVEHNVLRKGENS